MDRDLTDIFEEWPFESGQITVRVIEGHDGNSRIQVRLDLGLLQMNIDNRPDGKRPHGYDSMLEYYEARIDQNALDLDPDESTPPKTQNRDDDSESFLEENSFDKQLNDEEGEASEARFLTEDDCRALREEAQQYYHRYIAMLVLEDYEAVVRDTSRNLRVLDLFRDHAINEDDMNAMESHRPYIMMMRARSLASLAIGSEENKAAILAINNGIEALKLYFGTIGRPELFDESGEVAMLRDMKDSLIPKLPVSQKAELRQRLDAAIASENFELAAILRDEIRMLGG